MSKLKLQLPTIQKWDCQSCAGCCRQHLIEITEEERDRIEKQAWTTSDGLPEGRPALVQFGSPWSRRWRLGHQADGACVFLDEDGLCRIHAKHGEAAKPLACRVYPYAFHPAGKEVAVSLRFSCPTVVGNQGRTVQQNRKSVEQIAREVVPDSHRDSLPPSINGKEMVSWPDFHEFIRQLDGSLEDAKTPFPVRLLRALFWVNMLGGMQFQAIEGERLRELLAILRSEAELQTPNAWPPKTSTPPSRGGRLQFRMHVAQYARKDTAMSVEQGWRGRIGLLKAAIRFARGKGLIPVMQDGFREVPFVAVNGSFGGLPAAAEELFTRYFRIKIQGLHFCGPAYYDVPFVEGFQSLALMFPTVVWIARWRAAGDGRESLTMDDVEFAMTVADHHHGYSPALGFRGFRRRVRLMASAGDVERLITTYGEFATQG